MSLQLTNRVLLVRPAGFSYNDETARSNAFQNQLGEITPDEILKCVRQEFDLFAQTLVENGVEVMVVDDTTEPLKPDAIFPNNWISMHSDGRIVLYPMQAVNRRAERRTEIIDAFAERFNVTEIDDWSVFENQGVYLEGTGSMVFDHVSRVAYACYSPRTDKELFEQAIRKMHYEPLGFHAVDANDQAIYHTNVMMGIGEGFAVVCLESIPLAEEREYVIQSLEKSKLEIIPITLDQMTHFAGNVLALRSERGDQLLVLSKRAYDALNDSQLKSIMRHAKCVVMEIPTIESIGGGSARCMIAENFLPVKAVL